MKYLKFLYSYSLDFKENNLEREKEFFQLISYALEKILKQMQICPNDKKCFICISNNKYCELIDYIISGKIQCTYGYSSRFNLIHFLWVLKSDAIKLAPRLILLHDLLSLEEDLRKFDFHKRFYYFIPYQDNCFIEIFKINSLNLNGLNQSVYDFNEQNLIKLIFNKETTFTFYKYYPLLNKNLYHLNNLNSQLSFKINNTNIFDLKKINDTFEMNHLINFYAKTMSGIIPKFEIRNIIKRIIDSKFLIFDFKFNKFSFKYSIKNNNEIIFFLTLFEKGLLSFSLIQ